MARKLAAEHLPPGSCSDYKAGFEQAFIDVSMGTSGDVPPLAPKQYWTSQGRTAAGHNKAQMWFQGYGAGAEIARTYTDRFLDVATAYEYSSYVQPQYDTGLQY